jgi:hypothetical protein
MRYSESIDPKPMRRSLRALAAFLAVAVGVAALAAPAFAAATRGFDAAITGETPPSAPVPGPFVQPYGVGSDSSGGVWISDPSVFSSFEPNRRFRSGAITHYDREGGYVSQQTGEIVFEGAPEFIRSLAVSYLTGELYVAYVRPADVAAFEEDGSLAARFVAGLAGSGEISVAADNSAAGSRGRIYTVSNGDDHVRAFNGSGEPEDFEAVKSYISGNTITGTPSGPFGDSRRIAVGPHGEIYVSDRQNERIDEFRSSGEFIREVTGAEVPGGFASFEGIAVDPTNGNLLVADAGPERDVIDEFNESGHYLGQILGPSPLSNFGVLHGIAVAPTGYLYVADETAEVVDKFLPVGVTLPEATAGAVTEVRRDAATLAASADPNGGGDVTSCHFSAIPTAEYKGWEDDPYAGPTSATAPCLNEAGETVGTPAHPIASPTAIHGALAIPPGISPPAGIPFRWRVSVANGNGIPRNVAGEDFELPPDVTEIATLAPTEVTQESATLHASFLGEEELETHYYFQYGTSTNYAHQSTVGMFAGTAGGAGSQPEEVSIPVSGLVKGTTYHYRVIAENKYGKTFGEDLTFTTYQPPTIESFSSSHLTATSARLEATIDPQSLPAGTRAVCRFEYGTTTAYDSSAPCPEPLEATSPVHVAVEVTNLESGATYHFRVVAESRWGTVASEDQSFEFFPPSCPNSPVRQQTGANYLPDCRAYELVSPGEANGTLLFSGGPNTGEATNPSRFSFVGAFSSLPGAGNPIVTAGDLYVATRTATGWVSKYVGLPGNESGCVGGPPNDPNRAFGASSNEIQNAVATNPEMSRFMDWADGNSDSCLTSGNGTGDASWSLSQPSNAPYLWNADGSFVGRLPASFSSAPGAPAAFSCPVEGPQDVVPKCSGDVAASGDLSHLAYSSIHVALAPGGLTEAPGSAYDENTSTGAVTVISKLPNGEDIGQEPGYSDPTEFIRFPAVSNDGSHILMSTATVTTSRICKESCPEFTSYPIHLYMSVDDAVTYDVSQGKDVHYVGMTPDGSRVYFTSGERLTPEDHDSSTDLYMWSQAGAESGHPLTLISKGDNEGQAGEPGNSDSCSASWTTRCGVLTYSEFSYSQLWGNLGGNGLSDNSISANGDIYFYSPEQLDGDHGALGQQNLYDYRNGRVQYVATLAPGHVCLTHSSNEEPRCSEGPIARMQVSPDDAHMAFVTASQLSSYPNDGHLEMYSYTPSTGALACDSCNPDGEPPTSDVYASQDGLFMADDGRTFFSTTESLVARDTNEATDVYEYADGRPRLITPGTGTLTFTGENLVSLSEIPGLIGVSADGTDAFFSTYDSLTPEDHNGAFLKFYDARANGGFAVKTPVAPCAAAEECRGTGSEAPAAPPLATAARLSGGNLVSHRRHHHRKRRRVKRGHRHHGAVRKVAR